MKALLTSILLGAFALTAAAGETSATQRTFYVRKVPKAVTGSNIPRNVKRIGNTYDTPQNIYVIDRTRIERSGAQSVGDLLRRVPFARVR